MWLNIIKLSIPVFIVVLSFSACTNDSTSQGMKQVEEDYLMEVVQRRIQGRQLIDLGLRSSKNENCRKILQAMAQYYANTDCLFSSLMEDYPSLAVAPSDVDNDLEYMKISDGELVEVLQMHVYGTLNLYKGGVMMNLNDKHKRNFLLLMPALAAQNEDLKVLQNRSEVSQFISGQ